MPKILARLRAYLAMEPAITAWVANGGLAMIAAYFLHFTKTEEAALATIVTAVASAWTALRARPPGIALAVGALVTAITAAGAFGLHPSQHTVAIVTALTSIALGLLFRQNITPVAALRMRRAKAAAAAQERVSRL